MTAPSATADQREETHEEWVTRIVSYAPQPSAERRARLARLLRPGILAAARKQQRRA